MDRANAMEPSAYVYIENEIKGVKKISGRNTQNKKRIKSQRAD